MALKKIIKNENGIITEYHKISSVELKDLVTIKITSYISDEYRNMEKEFQEKIKLSELLNNQITEEMQKTEPNQEKIKSLAEQLNSIVITRTGNLSVMELTESFEFDKSVPISYEFLYEKLKSTEKFLGAEDC